MATVIDSFLIEIGIDPSKMTKGQQVALDALRGFEEEAGKRSRYIEDSSKRAGDALGGIRTQALELFAIFTGGKGAIDFVTGMTHANAQLGRLERNLGVSASMISKWQGAARIFGGDAASMAQSFTSISDAVEGFKIGAISPLIAEFRNLSSAGGTVIDVNKGVEQTLLDIAENLKKVHDSDPARAGLLGRRLGLDPALFDLLVRGREGAQQVLEYVKKIGVATHEDADAFGELEKRMNQMGLKAESLGRKLLGGEGGGAAKINALADELNKPISEARPFDAIFGWGQYAPGAKKSSLFPAPGAGEGAFKSQDEKKAFILSEAAKRGMDPDVALAVAKSEGFDSFLGDNGTSGGSFQLHVTPGGRGRAVGDQFKAATGKDPLDPANEREGIQFALDDAKAHGWSAYHGAARKGIGDWQGINPAPGSVSTTKVDINGPITINAGPNADGKKIGEKFVSTIKGQSFAAQANSGQN